MVLFLVVNICDKHPPLHPCQKCDGRGEVERVAFWQGKREIE
jgi:hypothetical protein